MKKRPYERIKRALWVAIIFLAIYTFVTGRFDQFIQIFGLIVAYFGIVVDEDEHNEEQ